MYYSIVNQRGERRSPYTTYPELICRWFGECAPYFEGEQFELQLSKEMDKGPEIDNNGTYACTIKE